MFRRYNIAIVSSKDAPQMADSVLKDFGCSVSEPSNWLPPGNGVRGLTFLDKKGKELNSFLFKHQPYFNVERNDAFSESQEIEALIFEKLQEYYHVDANEVLVKVTEYNNL